MQAACAAPVAETSGERWIRPARNPARRPRRDVGPVVERAHARIDAGHRPLPMGPAIVGAVASAVRRRLREEKRLARAVLDHLERRAAVFTEDVGPIHPPVVAPVEVVGAVAHEVVVRLGVRSGPVIGRAGSGGARADEGRQLLLSHACIAVARRRARRRTARVPNLGGTRDLCERAVQGRGVLQRLLLHGRQEEDHPAHVENLGVPYVGRVDLADGVALACGRKRLVRALIRERAHAELLHVVRA